MFNKKIKPLKCFFDENRNLNYLRQVDRDIQTVEIDKIKGSVGRCLDFNAQFHSKSGARLSERFLKIKESMAKEEYFPVVELYKLADEYYVLDGHHRISAAKELGYVFIDAHVVEHLPSRKESSKVRDDFEKKTGLKGFQLTRPDDYLKLLRQIENWQEKLTRDSGNAVSIESAAQDWFENIYQNVRAKIEELELNDDRAVKTLDDIFVHLCDQTHLKHRKLGRSEEPMENLWKELGLSCETPSSKKSNQGLREKIKKIFLPCFYTGRCES